MKQQRLVYRFYRACFYRRLNELANKGPKPERGALLQSYILRRARKIKLFKRMFKHDPVLGKKYKYLCYSLTKCKLPMYLNVKGYKKQLTKKDVSGNPVYCSKTRFCGHCWIRTTCRSFVKMVKAMPTTDGYIYAYKSKVSLIDADASTYSIINECRDMFTKRHKFSSYRLKRAGILGISETLCVYPIVANNKKVFALELRQIAYCHPASIFALAATSKSDKIFGSASIDFCSFPANYMKAGVATQIKLDTILKRIRLTRRSGIMYNPEGAKVDTSPPIAIDGAGEPGPLGWEGVGPLGP
jgi:hypothetical protein